MLDDLTCEHVRSIFTYSKKDGLLRWRFPAGMGGKIPAGSVAGGIHPEGYRQVSVNGKTYRVSRIIWLYVTGKWPKGQLDHKDRNPGNDKWSNLREANGSQNKANNGKYKRQKPGKCHCEFKGVMAVQKARSIRYRAGITKDGKRMNLGSFDTAEQAHAAYMKAAKALFGEFASSGMEQTHG